MAKRLGGQLREGHVIAFKGEAGYQASLLMPGLRFRPWLVYSVKKFPWVQVPADGIGVVIAQVGAPLPPGAKSAFYNPAFGNFADVRSFIDQGGQQGVQRPVLPPGSLVPMHPVGFLVLTYAQTFGFPVSPDMLSIVDSTNQLTYESFGLQLNELQVVRIAPEGDVDYVGVVTTLEGDPLPSGDIAGRLGGYTDVEAMEAEGRLDQEIMELLLGSKNNLHNNYQDPTLHGQRRRNNAAARTAEAEGEANFTRMTGEAQASRTQAIGVAEARAIEAQGLARAVGYEAQTDAFGSGATAIVAVAQAVSEGHVKVVPDVLVAGGGGSVEGLAATLMNTLAGGSNGGEGIGSAKKRLDAVVSKVEKDAGKHRSSTDMVPEAPIEDLTTSADLVGEVLPPPPSTG
ncbi:MAG: hypothetical protein ABJB55_01785 [Actinomycetota bacterium]